MITEITIVTNQLQSKDVVQVHTQITYPIYFEANSQMTHQKSISLYLCPGIAELVSWIVLILNLLEWFCVVL